MRLVYNPPHRIVRKKNGFTKKTEVKKSGEVYVSLLGACSCVVHMCTTNETVLISVDAFVFELFELCASPCVPITDTSINRSIHTNQKCSSGWHVWIEQQVKTL
jgi:hypothetical protein